MKGRFPTRSSPIRRSEQISLAEALSIRSSLDLHVLGTPPAFILSQDRTLVKIVDLGSDERQLSLVLSFPYLLLRFSSHFKRFSAAKKHLLRRYAEHIDSIASARASTAAASEIRAFLCRSRTFGFCMCFTVQFSRNCVLLSLMRQLVYFSRLSSSCQQLFI